MGAFPGRQEERLHAFRSFRFASRLVVNDPEHVVLAVCPVDCASYARPDFSLRRPDCDVFSDLYFRVEEGERRIFLVQPEQLPYVAVDNLRVDQLRSVVFGKLRSLWRFVGFGVEEQFPESVVHIPSQPDRVFQQPLDRFPVHRLLPFAHVLVDMFGCIVEDASELGRIDVCAHIIGAVRRATYL